MPFISPAQVRAARAMLDWTIVDLAKKARISISTVKRFEDGQGAPSCIRLMQDALETEGVRFLEDDGAGVGVRCRAHQSASKVGADAGAH